MRPEVYGRIAERASPQLGLVTDRQLVCAGTSREERRTMLRSGGWERRGRHVFADRAAPRTTVQELLAATLDVRRPAYVTAATAAWLIGLDGFGPNPIHVLTKRGGRHRAAAGVTLHETFWLPQHHTAAVRGVPTVSTARLAFELASLVPPARLRRLVDRLKSAHGMTYEDMALVAAELWRRGKPGSAEMRRVVDERMPGYVPPASELAALFDDLCVRFGLPLGAREVNAGGDAWIGRVDVVYRDQRVIVELDSRRWHDTSTAFDDDRARSNALVAAGWRVIRITWRMVVDTPRQVAALLAPLLGTCGASGG